MKNFVVAVSEGLKREIDSMKAIGSMEVGVTCEEPQTRGKWCDDSEDLALECFEGTLSS